MFYNDIPQNQLPIGFYSNLKNQYGDLNDEATYKKYRFRYFQQDNDL